MEVNWYEIGERGLPVCLYCRKEWDRIGVGPIMWCVPKVTDENGTRTVSFNWYRMAHPECIAKEFQE